MENDRIGMGNARTGSEGVTARRTPPENKDERDEGSIAELVDALCTLCVFRIDAGSDVINALLPTPATLGNTVDEEDIL